MGSFLSLLEWALPHCSKHLIATEVQGQKENLVENEITSHEGCIGVG